MKPIILLLSLALHLCAADFSQRFETIKKSASPAELYAFLFALPKGGDLHHHNTLSAYAKVWYGAATTRKALGRNTFFTLVEQANCPGTGDDSLPRYYTI